MKVVDYIKETKNEMHLVKWPTRKQTILYTAVVITVSVLVALYLGLFDFIFSKLLKLIA